MDLPPSFNESRPGLRLRMPRDVRAPATARAALMPLRAHLGDELTDDLALLVSELVTNAVVHGAGPSVRLELQVMPERLRVEVVDEGEPGKIGLRDPGPDGGFGLHVVDARADRWGVAEGSSHVWFEVDRRDAA